MQKDGSKKALRGKFQRAGWDNAYLCLSLPPPRPILKNGLPAVSSGRQ
jgi:hypothetical protein